MSSSALDAYLCLESEMSTSEDEGFRDFAAVLDNHETSTPYSSSSPDLNSRECLSDASSPDDYSALPSASGLEEPNLEGIKSISYWSGVCLVVGEQIGSGIFSTSSVVTSNVRSVGMSLVIWIIAGGLTWTGAGTFIPLIISEKHRTPNWAPPSR